MAKYRVLSLDGGGPWALIQVKALQQIYGPKAPGHHILHDFDLVAANSGGSLTLAGLIENTNLDELLNRYFLNEQNRKSVFREVTFWKRLENFFFELVGIAPKYSTDAKRRALTDILTTYGATKLPEIVNDIRAQRGKCPHFVICSFDFDRRRAIYFRSDRNSKAQSSHPGPPPTLVEAVHASTNAPITFFDAPAEVIQRRCWDGAIAGNNNPVLVGVVEALAAGAKPKQIEVLSIGTGSVRLPAEPQTASDPCGVVQPRQEYRILGNVKELAGSILDDPPDVATFMSYVVLEQPLPAGGPGAPPTSGSVIRMNPMIEPQLVNDVWQPPPGLTCTELKAIANLPVDAIEQPAIIQVANLGDKWLQDQVPNQPIRSSPKDFSCEVGHSSFSAALAAWRALIAPPGPPAGGAGEV